MESTILIQSWLDKFFALLGGRKTLIPREGCVEKDLWKDPYAVAARYELGNEVAIWNEVRAVKATEFWQHTEENGEVAYWFIHKVQGKPNKRPLLIKLQVSKTGIPICWSFHEWIENYDSTYLYYAEMLARE